MIMVAVGIKTSSTPTKPRTVFRFDDRKQVVLLCNNMAILLSFGVLFPPIAVVGCIAIVVQLMMQKKLVLDLIQTCKTWVTAMTHPSDSINLHEQDDDMAILVNQVESILKQTEESCGRFSHIYVQTMRPIVFYVCTVWGLFVWDIVGGEVGVVKSMWTFLLMVMIGVLFVSYEYLGLGTLCNRWLASSEETSGRSSIIELAHVQKKGIDGVADVIVENPLYATVTKPNC
jgi:hypothetical protein